MFAFHKNETLSRSRQSSVDSPLVQCSSLTSVPDSLTASQCSDSAHTEGMHSPEQRRRAPSRRRSSVFNLRARSNTAASTASSIIPTSHTDMASHEHGPGSPQTGSRRSTFRGRMGKRLSESAGAGGEIDDYQEADAGRKRTSFLRKGRKSTHEPEASLNDVKYRISSPFDFQHLTHTNRHQVAALEQAPGSVLFDGWAERAAHFSTRRASGAQTLTGPHDISTGTLVASESDSVLATDSKSPPCSPRTQSNWQQSQSTVPSSDSRPELRLTRSVESFSQPGINPRAHQHSSSIIAPPRVSSLLPMTSIHNIPEEGMGRRGSASSTSSRSKRQSGVWDAFTLSVAASTNQLPGIEEDHTYVGNALTTPDDSAIQAMTPPYSPSLENVAEEPERYVSPRPAPQPPRLRSPTSPKAPFLESFSFDNQRSSSTRTRQRGNSRASPKSFNLRNLATRPTSQVSETLVSPSLTRESPIPRSSVSRRKSNTWRAIEESWEDDVDYIYEHALEADCENNWDCISEDEGFADPHHALAQAVGENRTAAPRAPETLHPFSGSKPMFQLQLPFLPSRRLPNNDSVPDLGSGSAASASTTGTGLQTPFHESESFISSPNYKGTQETSYEDILEEYVSSDFHFPIMDLDESTTSSARSSRVRFSRRSSYDSSLMSSAQSSGLWNSPVRRSASSAGSLPDLVHSRRTRQNFGLAVDELSEQVASLGTCGSDGEENDDVTLPGSLRRSQDSADIQSYQRNKHYHKLAMSDGAAQLLASTEHAKPRSRAATASNTDGEKFLHLFPTPPSFSPTSN